MGFLEMYAYSVDVYVFFDWQFTLGNLLSLCCFFKLI